MNTTRLNPLQRNRTARYEIGCDPALIACITPRGLRGATRDGLRDIPASSFLLDSYLEWHYLLLLAAHNEAHWDCSAMMRGTAPLKRSSFCGGVWEILAFTRLTENEVKLWSVSTAVGLDVGV